MPLPDLTVFQQTLGVEFRDPQLLQQALAHRSYLHENQQWPTPSYERLEFLGDAVIGLVAAELLFLRYPELGEGALTRLRTALVRRETLAELARNLRLGDYLYMSRGEAARGGRRREAILAAAYEALVGAIFLDQGFDIAKDFILRTMAPIMEKAIEESQTSDYKSRLQEMVQSRGKPTPFYRTVATVGPEHDRTFIVEAVAGSEVLGRGVGANKRVAQREAARTALETLGGRTGP